MYDQEISMIVYTDLTHIELISKFSRLYDKVANILQKVRKKEKNI